MDKDYMFLGHSPNGLEMFGRLIDNKKKLDITIFVDGRHMHYAEYSKNDLVIATNAYEKFCNSLNGDSEMI